MARAPTGAKVKVCSGNRNRAHYGTSIRAQSRAGSGYRVKERTGVTLELRGFILRPESRLILGRGSRFSIEPD